MIEDGEVRPEGCICEPCSDIQRYQKSRVEILLTKKGIGIYIIKKMLRATNMVNITDNRTTLGFELKQWQMAVVIL